MANANIIKFPAPKQEPTRFGFTSQRLCDVEPTGKTFYVYDTQQPGLCLRVSAGGAKSFVYYRKINGRPERVTLGKLGALSIADARTACKHFEGQKAIGGNPAAEKRSARHKGARVDDLMESWVRSAQAKKLRSLPEEERLYARHIKPSLGRREAKEISAVDVERLMHRLRDRPRMANRVHDLLRRLFKLAIVRKVIPDNPCNGVTRYAENVRDRVLSIDEIQAFLSAVEAEDAPWRSYFKLLLLTGARKGAVAAMRWNDLDLTAGVWTIPGWASKNKKTLVIALVPQAVEVIGQIEKIDQTWVFPSNSECGHVVEPTKSWRRIKKAAGLQDVRIHDLRRTVGTTLAVNGASAHVIAKALGHKNIQSAQAYVHLNADVARAALEGVTSGWLK
jgi:integrase